MAASYVVANDICPANIPPSIPSGVSVVDSGNISPISQANVPYNFVSAIVMTTAAVQTKLASALTFARIVLDKTPDQTTVPTGIVTTFSGANETYGFQKYPANDPKRLLTSFTEKLYQYENEVDTGSLSLPPSDATHRPAGWKYVEQKSYQTDGRYSECVDVPGSAVERIVQATPDDVHQFMKDEHTSTPITWHSIVFNKDKCPANNEGASNGEDYLNMTEKTNGVSQAICTDNFEGFFKSLYANVIHQVVVKYTIPDARIGQNPIRVFNESTQSELARGKDYVIEGNQMVFDPKKVNKGNFVTVEY
ncbi:MAG: hypothetical protein NTV34_12210 [Proteobacteria bacterium]|nr:hypothetical protein [Pseudomonadota bacterium]